MSFTVNALAATQRLTSCLEEQHDPAELDSAGVVTNISTAWYMRSIWRKILCIGAVLWSF